MTARNATLTERLTGEKMVLTLSPQESGQNKAWRVWVIGVVVAVAVVLAGYFSADWLQTALRSKQALMQDLQRVRQELGNAQRSYQIELATRKELEERLLELSGQLTAAQVELEFMKAK